MKIDKANDKIVYGFYGFWIGVIFIFFLFFISFLCNGCAIEYDSYHTYDKEIPPDEFSKCDNIGEKRRYEYGDYAICIECVDKIWIEIDCEDF